MTSLTLVRRIKAAPDIVFEAVTSAEGIAHWWGPDAGPVLLSESDPRVGGSYRLRFRTLPGAEHECSGEFLVVDPPKRVVMSWRWTAGGDDPALFADRAFAELSLRRWRDAEHDFANAGALAHDARFEHFAGRMALRSADRGAAGRYARLALAYDPQFAPARALLRSLR